MNVLAVGDVFGSAGLRAVKEWLPRLVDETQAGFVIVNAENVHGGKGIDLGEARVLFDAGADVLTTGNHVWAHKGYERLLDSGMAVLRPANYPDPCPGRGVTVAVSEEGPRVAVVNLIGRVFMPPVDDPFRAADAILAQLKGKADLIVVDFHAEATSEKLALATHLDGRVAGVFGTHTHVQTADARVLPGGTGFITDLGMTGPYDSIIGMTRESALRRFLTARPAPAASAEGAPGLRGALFDIDESAGTCRAVTRIARGAGGQ